MVTEIKKPLYSLSDLKSKARSYEREKNPKAFKEMKKDGNLEEYLKEIAESAQRYAENLMASGVWAEEAWNRAIRSEILHSESD